MDPLNQKDVANLITEVKTKLPNKTIWVYTGYVIEDLYPNGRANTDYTAQILDNINVLVDGPFVEAKKDLSLKFRGSSNQRIIDMEKTRTTGIITEYVL